MVADNLDLLVLEVCDVYSCRSAWSAVVDSDLLWLQPLLAHLVYCIWPITFLIYMQSWTFSIRQRSEREGSKEWICEGTCSIHNIQWSIMREYPFPFVVVFCFFLEKTIRSSSAYHCCCCYYLLLMFWASFTGERMHTQTKECMHIFFNCCVVGKWRRTKMYYGFTFSFELF